jgi:hypothetical protein
VSVIGAELALPLPPLGLDEQAANASKAATEAAEVSAKVRRRDDFVMA